MDTQHTSAGVVSQFEPLPALRCGGNSRWTRLDPIVRVQARNLRSRLEKYYETAGAEDPIRIELPKGTYVPVFHFRTALASEAARAARCAASANAAVPTPKVDAKHC